MATHIVDLFFISNPTLINGGLINKTKTDQTKPRKVFLYKKYKVNYLKSDMKEMIRLITSPENASKSANELWSQF